jgi:hypothetical protein
MDFKKNRELALYTSEQYKDSFHSKVLYGSFSKKFQRNMNEKYHEVQLMH